MGLFNKKHSVGKTIATLRKENGWTQVELAEKLQVSDKAVSKWEKDDSFPSVEFFPALAELFGVSIDYLMTGKAPEEKVIAISKIELCAKNDDPKLLGEFNSRSKDENGKTLIDYVKKYSSLKVLKTLFERCSHQTHYMCLFGRGDWIDLSKCADEILLLMKINCEIKYVSEVCRQGYSLYSIDKIEEAGYLPIIKYLIENYDKISDTQKNYYFGKDSIIRPRQAWINAYPYFLEQSYKMRKKKVFDELLSKIMATNSNYTESNEKLRREMGNYYDKHFRNWAENHVLIKVRPSMVELAYKNGDICLGEKLNAVCQKPLSKYEIESILIDKDLTLTNSEKILAKTIHEGVVCIDELMAINDFNIFKKTLGKYPIHIVEVLMDKLQNNKLREIYQFAVDENDSSLATMIIKEDIEGAKKHIATYWRSDKYNINSKHLFILKNNRRIDFYSTTRSYNEYKTIDSILAFIEECRQRIINDLSLKLDKEKTTGELTREYFLNLLAKGDIEMLIIKLCVRLEAILRCDYHYEGDFVKMIDQYCSTFNTYDDEDNNYDPYTPRLLHKLRMMRNGIVHSEKCNDTLNVSELQECIDHICKMG